MCMIAIHICDSVCVVTCSSLVAMPFINNHRESCSRPVSHIHSQIIGINGLCHAACNYSSHELSVQYDDYFLSVLSKSPYIAIRSAYFLSSLHLLSSVPFFLKPFTQAKFLSLHEGLHDKLIQACTACL